MSDRPPIQEEPKQGAARWIPAYAALNTILLAFFIILSVNMGKQRSLGYMGPGLGAFKEAFTSRGLPALLTGAKRIVNFFTWGGKYIPEDAATDTEAATRDVRLIEPPERDLDHLLTDLTGTEQEVELPLPIRYGRVLDKEAKESLASAARLLRSSEHEVMVCAVIPAEPGQWEDAWVRASAWAMQAGSYLVDKEHMARARVTAVGSVASAQASGDAEAPRPTLTLRIRPTAKTSDSTRRLNLQSDPAPRRDIIR